MCDAYLNCENEADPKFVRLDQLCTLHNFFLKYIQAFYVNLLS